MSKNDDRIEELEQQISELQKSLDTMLDLIDIILTNGPSNKDKSLNLLLPEPKLFKTIENKC